MHHRFPGSPPRWSLVSLAGIVSLLCGSGLALAASPTPWSDTIVSPRKTPESRLHTTRAVTVLTSDDFDRWGTVLVGDALRHVVGVYVRRDGGSGRLTTAVIRGSGSAHVLVLVDGVQVNSPTTGAFNFADLTTDNIDRIEILRGGASTLYGSDAVGGVISIFTKNGRDELGMGGSYTQEIGSDRTFRERGEFQWTTDRFRVSSSVSRFDTSGVSANDDYRNITYSTRSVAQLSDALEFDASMRYHKGRVGIDDGAFLPDPNRRNTEQVMLASAMLRHRITDGWRHSLQVAVNRSELIDLDKEETPGEEFFGPSESRLVTELTSVEWRHDVDVADWGGVATGFELKDRRGSSANFDKSLFSWAWYLNPHVTLWDRLTLVSGVRLFRHNTFGRDETWEASASYALSDRSALRAGFAKGYHAPTINDLYFPNFSNPGLTPEESESYEVGFSQEWLGGKVALSTTLFHREVDDLIQSAAPTFIPVNIGETEQKGVELELAAELTTGLSLAGHYTYVSAHQEPSKEELLRIPQQTAEISLHYTPIERLSFDARYTFVGSREDVGRLKAKRYGLVDLGAHMRVSENFELYARVENLLGRTYQEIIGFPTQGTQVFIGGRLLSWGGPTTGMTKTASARP